MLAFQLLYVLGIIAEQSGAPTLPDLNTTLAELFHTFFPGKEYRGPVPQPDGSLTFPVYLESGGQHDIDELSSGEKELLYGYLRLRNSAPRSSVILLDEPELHLNPRLLQGLPDFYHANLGRALNNQLWLVTHSDSILRQVVGNPNYYSAFHMSAPQLRNPQQEGEQNQAALVTANSELHQAVLDIVGDLAAYKPRAKVVILEGGGDTESDVEIVSRLFPVWAQSVNLVPGGSKRRVMDLYEILETATLRAGLSERFFAIVDRDREPEDLPLQGNVYRWDRYHIENYFLENEHLAAACSSVLGVRSSFEGAILDQALLACARSLVDTLVLERLQAEVNDSLVNAIRVKASPDTRNPARDLMPSIGGSLRRLSEVENKYSETFLDTRQAQIRSTLDIALTNGEWRREFPGRLILKRFVGQHVQGVNYEIFRNIVLDKMVDAGYQPSGMMEVIARIN
jgi:AAA domain, putative AbiEii toxin, Type IV TA system